MSIDVCYETGRAVATINRILPHGLRATTLDLIISNGPARMMGPLLAKATPLANRGQLDHLTEIISNIQDWPGHMTVEQQGQFWLGFYRDKPHGEES